MTNSAIKAPNYSIHRDGVAQVDVMANTTDSEGINMSGYSTAHIQVIPSGGANPTVIVYWWSPEANAYVGEHASIAKAGIGVNVPFEFSVECGGRVMFVAVSVVAAGAVKVAVSGFERVFPG